MLPLSEFFIGEKAMKWIYFIMINVIAFSLMGLDKRKAKKKQWRTPESTLFLSAAAGEQLELDWYVYVSS